MTDKPKIKGYNWGQCFARLRASLQAIGKKAESIYSNGDDRAAAISFEVLRAHNALDELERIASDGHKSN